jgi:hypothetical protein
MIPEIGQILVLNDENKIKHRWWREFSQAN